MNNNISLIFSGDFVPIINETVKPDIFSNELIQVIKSHDLHITNLECPLTISGKKIKKSGPHLKAEPGNIELLKQSQVNVACLANNHIFDYSEQGILDTVDICNKNKIETLGIVNNKTSNESYLIKEINGKKIGLLNYCENEFSVRNENEIGANGYDPIKAYYEIYALRNKVDYLIVIYHGGNEMFPLPSPFIKKTLRYFIDLGADAVICHHTHVFSGMEYYKAKPIIYSLGNFLFDEKDNEDNWYYGLMAVLKLENKIEVELIPIEQCRKSSEVNLITGPKKDVIENRIKELSNIIEDDTILNRYWNKFVPKNSNGIIKNILNLKKWERFLFKYGFFRKRLLNQDKILTFYNLSRCESLNYLVKQVLKNEIE